MLDMADHTCPFICCSLDCQLPSQPLPGADILINITVTGPEKVMAAGSSSGSDAKSSAVQSVYLVYWVNYKGASTLSTQLMKRDGEACCRLVHRQTALYTGLVQQSIGHV